MQNTFSLTPSSVIFSILLFFPMHSVVCACVHACVCACVHANISVEGSLKCELLRKHNFINKLHFNSGLKCEKCRQAYYVLHLTCYVKYLLTVYHHSWLRCHVCNGCLNFRSRPSFCSCLHRLSVMLTGYSPVSRLVQLLLREPRYGQNNNCIK